MGEMWGLSMVELTARDSTPLGATRPRRAASPIAEGRGSLADLATLREQ